MSGSSGRRAAIVTVAPPGTKDETAATSTSS